MALRGVKPTPTNVKIVLGNPGRRPINQTEPKPRAAAPMPPAHISKEAQVEWARVCGELSRLGLLTGLDRAALAAYCQAYGRWEQAESALAMMAARDPVTHGMMIKTTNGNAIQNPLLGSANKAMADMMRYAAEFGMTPSARSRIESADEDEEDPLDQFVN